MGDILLRTTLKNVDTQTSRLDVNDYNRQIERVGLAAKRVDDLINRNDDSLKAAIDNMNAAIAALLPLIKDAKVTANINNNKGTVGKLINSKEPVNNFYKTVTSIDTFVQDFKNNPEKYINNSVFLVFSMITLWMIIQGEVFSVFPCFSMFLILFYNMFLHLK